MGQVGYTHIIWDWNGTLLDDVGLCISVINSMLKKRGLPVLLGTEAYRCVFGFPVIEYYRRLGFDFENEPFEVLAEEYIALYHSDARRFRLFPGAKELLLSFLEMGLRQVVLSASEINNLRSQIIPFHIEHCFHEILGISDIYAESKVEAGRAYIRRAGAHRAVLIGDTLHDRETAAALGVDCILVANGHQSKTALMSPGVPVVDSLKDVPDALKHCEKRFF